MRFVTKQLVKKKNIIITVVKRCYQFILYVFIIKQLELMWDRIKKKYLKAVP